MTNTSYPQVSNLTLRLRACAGAADQGGRLDEAAPTSSSQTQANNVQSTRPLPNPTNHLDSPMSTQIPSQDANDPIGIEREPLSQSTFTVGTVPSLLRDRPPVNEREERRMLEEATRLSMDGLSQTQPFPTQEKKGLSFEAEMSRRISAEMPRIADPKGDTAVYIDPPPQLPGQDAQSYRQICQHFRLAHLVQSKHLRALESQKIDDMFAPTAQFRMKRRLTKSGCVVSSDDKIKYHLDWRVPVEGDDALVLLEGLTCTKGTLDWVKAKEHYSIKGSYVHGEDDVELCVTSQARTEQHSEAKKVDIQSEFSRPDTEPKVRSPERTEVGTGGRTFQHSESVPAIPDDWSIDSPDAESSQDAIQEKNVTSSALDEFRPKKVLLGKPQASKKNQKPEPVERILNWDGDLPRPPAANEEPSEKIQPFETSHPSRPSQPEPDAVASVLFPAQEEYSPLRHRSAIERLLHAACGEDPRLDSAPKVWTYFAVAKYFECATHPKVNTWITVWLLDEHNANFIQANPEVVYQIGTGIKSDYLTQAAFSLLAAEKALAMAANSSLSDRKPAPNSIHRWKVEHLDDDEKNRIDHAANCFLHRIPSLFYSLIDNGMDWLQTSSEYRMLLSHKAQYPADASVVDDLTETLKWYLRTRLLHIQAREYRTEMDSLEKSWERTTKFYPLREPLHRVYNSLPMEARLLTRTFWIAVESAMFDEYDDSMFVETNAQGLPDLSQGRYEKIQDYLRNMNVVYTPSAKDIAAAAQAFNEVKSAREERQRWSSDLVELQERKHQTLSALAQVDALEQDSTSQHSQDQQSSLAEWFNRPWLPENRAPSPSSREALVARSVFRDPQYYDFDFATFLTETKKALGEICFPILRPAHIWQGSFHLPTNLIDTLLCFSDDEFKYLPLWAGGNDDGETGAVFDEADVPFLESGGFAPGRGIHSDASDISSDAASDAFSDIASTARGTTARASHKATEGTLDENNADEVGTEIGNMDDIWGDVRRSANINDKGKMIELATGSGSESIVMVDAPLATTGTDESQRGTHPSILPPAPGAAPLGTSQFGKTTLYNTEREGADSSLEGRSTSHHATEYGSDDIMDEDEFYDDDDESEGTAKGDVDSVDEDADGFDHMELSDDEMGFVEIERGD